MNTVHDVEIKRAARLVHAGFREVGWKWANASSADRVPSAQEIEWQIRQLAGLAMSGHSASTGGLTVEKTEDGDLSISVGVAVLWADEAHKPATARAEVR
jgi:hypothetical protein